MKKLLPPQLFLLVAVLMGSVCWYSDFTPLIPFPYNLAGLPLLVGGLLLAQINKNLFRRLATNVDTFAAPDQLVTSGMYRLSRNPMYLGMVIALVGIAVLCQGSLVSFGLVLAFFAVLDRWYVEYEETMMEKVFGQRYSDYCRTTRRWI